MIQTIKEERERTYEEKGENADVQTGCLSEPNMEYSCDTNNHGREHIRRWWRILMFKLVVCLSLTWSRVVIQTTVKERTHQEKGENADV